MAPPEPGTASIEPEAPPLDAVTETAAVPDPEEAPAAAPAGPKVTRFDDGTKLVKLFSKK